MFEVASLHLQNTEYTEYFAKDRMEKYFLYQKVLHFLKKTNH
jgi:hypothetical protein